MTNNSNRSWLNATEKINAVSQRDTPDLPDFGLYAFFTTLLLGVAAVVQSRLGKSSLAGVGPVAPKRDSVLGPRSFIAAVIIAYVLMLQIAVVDYRWATCLFVLTVGGYLSRRRRVL